MSMMGNINAIWVPKQPMIFYSPMAATAVPISVGDDGIPLSMAMKFTTSQNGGFVYAYRVYWDTGQDTAYTMGLYDASATLLTSQSITITGGVGWKEFALGTKQSVSTGQIYRVVLYSGSSTTNKYRYTESKFTATSYSAGPITVPASTGGEPNGMYYYGTGINFCSSTWRDSWYGIDIKWGPS